MEKRYADILRIAMKSPQNATGHSQAIRDVANATGYSYEHVRRIVSGVPAISIEFNERVCRLLGLDEDVMWQMATRDKIRQRLESIPTNLGGELEDDPVRGLWRRMAPDSRRKVIRIMEQLAEIDDLAAGQLPN